jgi:hypothetical protein
VKPGDTVQPTSVDAPLGSAACQASGGHHGLGHLPTGQVVAQDDVTYSNPRQNPRRPWPEN